MTTRFDDGNRANSALLGSTPSDGGAPWGGGANFNISVNQFAGGGGNTWAPSVLDAGTNQVEITALVVSVANGGLVLRYADINNFILIQVQTTGLGIYKRTGSLTFAQVGALYTGTISAASTVRVVITSANVISVYHNETLRIGPVTDAAGAANTKHGIVAYTIPIYDDLVITDLAAGGGTTYEVTLPASVSVLHSRSLFAIIGRATQSTVSAGDVKVIGARRSAVSSASAVITKIKARLMELAALVTNTASVRRSISSVRSDTLAALASARRSISARRSSSAAGLGLVAKSARKTTQVSSTVSGFFQSIRIRLMSLSASLGVTTSVKRSVSKVSAAQSAIAGKVTKLARKSWSSVVVAVSFITKVGTFVTSVLGPLFGVYGYSSKDRGITFDSPPRDNNFISLG